MRQLISHRQSDNKTTGKPPRRSLLCHGSNAYTDP